MKNKTLIIMLVITLMGIASISCALFTFGGQTTPEPEPYFGTTGGSLKFEPDSLPEAQAGVAYEVEILITQNDTPVGNMSLPDASLPAGLEFIWEEGNDFAKISGTPEETGTFTFVVDVWCYGTNVSGQTGRKEYSIVVNE